MSPAFIMRTSEPYQLPGTGSFRPNNLRYNSLRSAQHPTEYHRVYVIYSAIMHRRASFIFPAHRVRPSTGNNGRSPLTPEADRTDHRSHQPQTPSHMDAFRGSLGGDVDDSHTADRVHASFRQRVHPAIPGRHLPRGPFTVPATRRRVPARQDLDRRACPRLACGHG